MQRIFLRFFLGVASLSLVLAVGLALSSAFAVKTTSAEGVGRAYFKVNSSAGLDLIRPITRHEFPGGVFSVQTTPGMIRKLQANPHLEFRGLASVWNLADVEAKAIEARGGGKPSGGRACVLSDFGLPQVWYGTKQIYNDPSLTSTSGGAGVDLAVLDTGVLKTHPDISRRITVCLDATGDGLKNGCNDKNGHGTNVASIAVADSGADGKGLWGIAPETNLMVYKVCSGLCWSDDIARAINDSVSRGAEIISMSLGGSGLASDERAAIDNAVASGVLVVAAAGNNGPTADSMDYPGAYVKVMGIAAINSAEATASFSSRGVNNGDYIVEERELDMAAAGVSVLGAYKDGCYAYYSGTSQATPHVSGLAAKLWQGSGAATRTFLQNRAKLHDLDGPGDDVETGFGLPTVP